jgi:hypothetical protein
MEPSNSTMVHDCDECGKLNDWEMDFIDSMLKREEYDPELENLTDRQTEVLTRIWKQRCGQ